MRTFKFQIVISLILAMMVCAGRANAQNEGAVTKSDGAGSQEFKILTEIFVAGNSQAVSSNQTFFQEKLVFDFQSSSIASEPTQITIYDSRNRKFVLLDMERRIKLLLDNLQLLRIFDGMKNDLESNERTKHLVNSTFNERFDVGKMELVVENEHVSYRVIGERPADASILPRYHDFLDQYTFLSATDPSRLPPIARIHLNRAIKKYGLMQKEVVCHVKASGFQSGSLRASKASSQHSLSMSLNENDLSQIELAKKCWLQFEQVDLAEYRGIESVAAESNVSNSLKR